MTKTALRTKFLAERKALSPNEVAERSAVIAERFFMHGSGGGQLELPTTRTMHAFLPIVRQNEVDTWLIIRQLWRDFPAVQAAISVTDTASSQLAHYPLRPDTILTENYWGIPEPLHIGNPIPATDFDVVLVPLLAFDLRGHRVGYGKGYYDRFLANCRPDCQKIGLSLFKPVDRITDAESTDVRLDACLAPTQTYFF